MTSFTQQEIQTLFHAEVRVAGTTDQGLVMRAQRGDVDALGELYDRYNEHIFRYLHSRSGHQETAEDLTGEVFMRMLSNLHRYRLRQDVPFRAWLYQIARNLLIDHYRKEGGHELAERLHSQSQEDSEHNPAMTVEKHLELEKVQAALAKLDEEQVEVIALRFQVGLPLKDVADAMNKSTAAVKALQHRGLTALRLALAQEQE